MGNTQSSSSPKRNWFLSFVSKSSPTDWIQAIFGIPAFFVAILALFSANDAQQVSVQAKTVAREATQDLETLAGPGVLDVPTLAEAVHEQALEADQNIFVQLATYKARNCQIAEAAIDLFGKEFSPRPTLWKTPSGNYVVIAINAPSMESARALRDKAFEIAGIPDYENERLNETRIRIDPGWESLGSCPPHAG